MDSDKTKAKEINSHAINLDLRVDLYGQIIDVQSYWLQTVPWKLAADPRAASILRGGEWGSRRSARFLLIV